MEMYSITIGYPLFHIVIYCKPIGVQSLVNCKWGSWIESDCTATCGKSAVKVRSRKREDVGLNGSKECKIEQETTVSCNLDDCPGKQKLQ